MKRLRKQNYRTKRAARYMKKKVSNDGNGDGFDDEEQQQQHERAMYTKSC